MYKISVFVEYYTLYFYICIYNILFVVLFKSSIVVHAQLHFIKWLVGWFVHCNVGDDDDKGGDGGG